MAALPGRQTASFFAIQPIPSATPLDDEFNAMVGAAGFLKGGTTGIKLLVKSSDAADPPLEIDQVGAGPLAEWKQNGVLKTSIGNDGLITCANTGVNPGLNADRVDGIEGANIAKLDTNVVVLSKSWYYPVLPGAVETIESQPRFIVPSVGVNTITKIYSTWATGSASGASNIFTIKRRNAAGTLQSDVGVKDLNGAGQNIRDVNDIADVPLTAGDQIYPLFTTRNTASEQGVTISIEVTVKLS